MKIVQEASRRAGSEDVKKMGKRVESSAGR